MPDDSERRVGLGSGVAFDETVASEYHDDEIVEIFVDTGDRRGIGKRRVSEGREYEEQEQAPDGQTTASASSAAQRPRSSAQNYPR